MPTRNVSLTDELDAYVEQRIQSGLYDNASEVIRAALRALIQSEDEDKAKIEALRHAIPDGDEGPSLDSPTVIAEVRELIREKAENKKQKTRIA